MSLAELLSETCGNAGNVSSWETLREKGNSAKEQQSFEQCKGNYIMYFIPHYWIAVSQTKKYTGSIYSIFNS